MLRPATVALLATLYTAPLDADVVLLRNGDRLTGEVQQLKSDKLSLETSYAGTVEIDWSEVKTLDTERRFYVQFETGLRHQGTLQSSKQGMEVVGPETVPVALADVVEITPAAEPGFWKTLEGSVDLGYNFTSGNSELNQSSLGVLAEYRREKYKLSGSLTSLFSRQDDSEPTSRQTADARFDRFLTPRRFAFALTGFERNDRQELNLRSRFGGGFGVTVVKDAETELSILGGATVINEQYQGDAAAPPPPRTSSGEGLAGVELKTSWLDWVQITSRLSFLPNFVQRGRYRLEYDGTARVPLLKGFTWSLTLFERFDSDPRTDIERNDYGVVSAFGFTF